MAGRERRIRSDLTPFLQNGGPRKRIRCTNDNSKRHTSVAYLPFRWHQRDPAKVRNFVSRLLHSAPVTKQSKTKSILFLLRLLSSTQVICALVKIYINVIYRPSVTGANHQTLMLVPTIVDLTTCEKEKELESIPQIIEARSASINPVQEAHNPSESKGGYARNSMDLKITHDMITSTYWENRGHIATSAPNTNPIL
ncbi:hypothetical protein L484_013063 [Morus notabilis]|uniref:Uncharacterized protein n=1 Tax=Morus notabilis TaxID=981085 RepID=W9R9J1_9ROSA|nr:hypothetical protein L484_013063 [Morus notabilis]